MKRINHAQLLAKISEINGTRPVGIDSLTDAGLLKTGNPNQNVLKKSRFVAMIGANYQNAVNNQAKREENAAPVAFVAAPLPWGEWVKGLENKVKVHKGKFYLRTETTPGERRMRTPKVEFLTPSGEKLAYETVKPFIPIRKEGGRQESHGNAGIVKVRDFAFDSIRKIRMGGETFEIEQAEKPLVEEKPAKRAVRKLPKIGPWHESQNDLDIGDDPREWDSHKQSW